MMKYTDNEALTDGMMLPSSGTATSTTMCGGLLSTTTRTRRTVVLFVVAVLVAIVVPVTIALTAPRTYRTNTQGSNIAFGTVVVDGVGISPYVLLDWTKRFDWDTMSEVFVEGARQILLLDDLQDGGHGSNEQSSSEYPWAIGYGYASSSDGTIVYEYATNTTHDQQVSFSIDGSPYDLSMGGLFLIRTADGVQIQQLDMDMPIFKKSDNVNDAVQSFAESSDEILAFLKEISEQQRQEEEEGNRK